jgi:Chaperone of endosialidase
MRAIASGNVTAVYGNATVGTGTGKGVEGDSSSTSGTGVAGVANATTGSTQGVWGANLSTSGVGVLGQSYATSGSAIGVEGLSASSTGTAGVFNNTGGGKILSGQSNGTEVFSVNPTGVVTGSSFQIGSKLFAFGSLVSENAFLGFAGNTSTTGQWNTASGFQALLNNTSGNGNTANGYLAMMYNTTGGYNTAIGAGAGLSGIGVSGSNNISIGFDAAIDVNGGGSNNIEIGNQGTYSDNGAIRIGTAGTQTSAFIAGIYGMSTSVNNAVPVLIDSNGNLGTISSSRRYKEEIQDMGDASSGLMRLRPVTFRYKKPFADGSQPMQYGLIAEEVADVYPDMVAHSADGQIETVKYQLLDPMLLNEVQRQQAEIRDLQERLGEVRELRDRLGKMEAALAAVSRASESR